MKIIALGDIHGRDCWKDIVAKHPEADKFVFLGDYVSTHEGISATKQCDNLREILDFKTENPDKVVLLRGNHDMQHLGYHWGECSGYFREVANWLAEPYMKQRFLSLTQWVFVHDCFVFSHAGVSQEWLKNVGLDDVNKINELEPSEKFGFWPCKLSDYSGDSCTQPPTWIRPWSLIEYAYSDYTYIVGHTSYRGKIINVKDECIANYKSGWSFSMDNEYDRNVIERYSKANDIYCCDALPHQYLIIDNGIVSIGKLID